MFNNSSTQMTKDHVDPRSEMTVESIQYFPDGYVMNGDGISVLVSEIIPIVGRHYVVYRDDESNAVTRIIEVGVSLRST